MDLLAGDRILHQVAPPGVGDRAAGADRHPHSIADRLVQPDDQVPRPVVGHLDGVDEADATLEVLAEADLLVGRDHRPEAGADEKGDEDELEADVLHGIQCGRLEAGSVDQEEEDSEDSSTCWTASRLKVIRVLLLSSTLSTTVSLLTSTIAPMTPPIVRTLSCFFMLL